MLIKLQSLHNEIVWYYDVDKISRFTKSNTKVNGTYTLTIEFDGKTREVRYYNATSLDEDFDRLIKAKGGVV